MKRMLKKIGRLFLWGLPALLAIYVAAKVADYGWYRLQIPIGFHDANWTGNWDTEYGPAGDEEGLGDGP